MKDIMELIDLLLKDNPKFWYALFFVATLWLFKEVRNRYTKEYDFEISRLDKVLEVHGVLELHITKYLKYNDEETKESLYEKITIAYPLISNGLYRKWVTYAENPTRAKLQEFLSNVQKETASLKWEQEARIPMIKKDFLFYCLSHLKTFLIPAIITVIALLIILLLIISYYISSNEQIGIYDKFNIFATITGILLELILMYFVAQLIADKKFKHNLLNWSLMLMLAVSMIVLIIFKIAIVFIVLYILYMVYLASKLVIQVA